MEDVALKLAAIGAAGIGAQWLAWRLKLPAIVLLLVAGFIAGPVTGFIDPGTDFGEIYKPIVGLAVAIILFEGGLTLNFRDLAETSKGVRRMIVIAGPLTWFGAFLAAYYVGGLSWPAALILGAILIVTGPTVIMPLLRSAKLAQRPSSMLRWEAIVNDPIGALMAVITFEIFLATQTGNGHGPGDIVLNVIAAFAFAVIAGYATGYLLSRAFIRGKIPDYLKAPVLFTTVLLLFAVSNIILEEAGLLTVTIMGITIANTRIASLTEMRRFKETVTVLLVSGIFILLTAALDWETIQTLDWNALAFVLLVLFVVRPVAVGLATIGTGLSWQERLLVGWIAPRGIVAVAIAGLFGAALVANGVEDGQRMIALTFAVVVGSILLHGFSLSPLSSILKLKIAEAPGILLVGGSRWSTALARRLKAMEIPVTISDSNWSNLSEARLDDIPVHFGDVLSEHSHHHLELNKFSTIIAATDNDAYNALVCTDMGPELGRSNVFQIGAYKEKSERKALSFTLGGRQLMSPGISYGELEHRIRTGWTFQSTRITEEFTFEKFQETRPEELHIVLWRKPDGRLIAGRALDEHDPKPDDVILSFAMARSEREELKAEAENETPSPKLPE